MSVVRFVKSSLQRKGLLEKAKSLAIAEDERYLSLEMIDALKIEPLLLGPILDASSLKERASRLSYEEVKEEITKAPDEGLWRELKQALVDTEAILESHADCKSCFLRRQKSRLVCQFEAAMKKMSGEKDESVESVSNANS